MKHNSKLFMFVSLLLVLGLLFAVLPIRQVKAQTVPYEPDVAIQKAADEIVNSQMPVGAWGSDAKVAEDTLGVIGSALIDAYARTADSDYRTSIQAAGDFLMTKTNNFSPADGMFAAKLDALLHVTTYTTHVKTNFFDRLATGNYGATGNMDTAEYIATLYSYVKSQDPALGLISAHLCGADKTLWANAVKAYLNTVNLDDSTAMLASAKGIYSLAYVGETFDPAAGSFAAAVDLAGMAAQLANYQQAGFFYPISTASSEQSDIQTTAAVILALDLVNSTVHHSRIQNAANWLLSVQNVAGYWTFGGEANYAITAVSIQAVNKAFPAVLLEALCTTDCYVATSGSDDNKGNLGTPFATIQKAVNTVADNGTIQVAPGTYTGQININIPVSIIGSGREGANATIISSNAVGTVLLGATGTVDSPIVLKDLQITGPGGIRTNITPIDYFTMDNVWLNANPVNSGEGLRVITGHQLTHLTIKNSIIEGYIQGVIVEKTPGTGNSGTKLQSVNVIDTIFRNNYQKGLYTETLSDAVFTNVQLINNGDLNTGTNLAEQHAAGFDLNLKDGTYSNLQFINMTATGNGLKAKEGAALMIKARSDGDTYGADPATLTNVTITGGSFTGNERGIRFGEPDKNNAGPTNMVITGATLLNNVKTYTGTDGSAYGDVVNYSLAKVNASGNWWGSAYGPQAPIYGNINVIQWCADAECNTKAPNAQGEILLSSDINVPGGIIIAAPGLTYRLAADTVIENNSPCFIIEASNTQILAAPGAKCIPTGESNGIDVLAGLSNITISDLEIDGSTQTTGTADGIHFAGAVSDFVLADNKIHNMRGDGIEFIAAPAGVVDIAGNLFQNNAGLGINAGSGAVLAKYNSWGSYDGPTAGAGISSAVDADPWTHADVTLSPINTNTTSRVVTSLTNVIGRPTVLKDGNLYHLWSGPSDSTLFHSVSTNPAEFPAGTPVTFSGGTPLEVASTAIFKEGITFYMVAYGANDKTFALYSSADGTAWTYVNQIFDASSMTDIGKIDAPFVFNDGGTFNLYFQMKHSSGVPYDIHLATSSEVNGTYALVNSDSPVLSPSSTGAWDGKYVMHPWVVKDGGTYYMWYSARNDVKPQQIGLATSTDGITWTKSTANPIIGPTGEPAVINDGGIWRMWYLSGGNIKYQTALNPLDLRQTLAYQVTANVVNVNSADITITYPSNLTIAELTSGTEIPGTFVTNVPSQISFHGYKSGETGLSGKNVVLFNVTFHTQAQGTGEIALGKAEFGMPGQGSSSNVYMAAAVDTATVEIKELPTLAIDLDSTYYLTGEGQTFTVTITNQGTTYTGAVLNLSLPADVIVTGVPAAIDLIANASQALTLTFTSATPGVKTIGFDLKDGASTLLFSTLETATVYDKPTITSTDIQGYYLTGEQREFSVTTTNPPTGRAYTNALFTFEIDADAGDITGLEYYDGASWIKIPLDCSAVSGKCTGDYGLVGGFAMPAPYGPVATLFRAAFITAKSYPVIVKLVDLNTEPDTTLVTYSNTAVVYTKPTISATALAGPFSAGVQVVVPVDITNPNGIPGPFELVFDLPAGTKISYGTPPVVVIECTATGCPVIAVDLSTSPTNLSFGITFNAAYNGSVAVSLEDTSWDPDRLLATYKQTGVVVSSGFAVTGTLSMQGNTSRAGIPVTFTWGGALVPYGPTGFSTSAISNNFSLTLLYGGDYTLTTTQPRYLNVTKTITGLAANRTMPTLQLKGGNARWMDETGPNNEVNIGDATLVGDQYNSTGTSDTLGNNGDCNGDGKVNIQDLALVGGNFYLTSDVAYLNWVP